ncbi:MAG TPA: DUF2017 family protein [Acidimicrobiia bacterium]|nr:DUF2017 family protein [Acidimicrobiia bacterium]
MQRRFRAAGGGIDVDLSSEERVFLSGLLEILAGVPRVGDDLAAQRLRVPVYLDDPESNDEWWRLMGEELSAARNSDRRVFQRVLSDQELSRLTGEEADAFLRVLNEGRLVLGARFGVEVEADHVLLPEDQRDILDFLGWLLEELTSELSRSL